MGKFSSHMRTSEGMENHQGIGDFDFNCKQRPLAPASYSYFLLEHMSVNFSLKESVLVPLGPFWIRIQIH
jgi:hypothetical protein